METVQTNPIEPSTDRPGSRPASRRRLLGELLIREGLITYPQLDDVLRFQAGAETARPLGELLVECGAISRDQLNFVLDKYKKKYRLGDLLVETNAITEAQLEQALEHQKKTDLRLGDVLLQLNFLTERQMKQALCKQLRVSFIDLDTVAIDPALTRLIPRAYAEQRSVLPVSRVGDTLTVAMDDPSDIDVVEELAASTGCQVEVTTSTRVAFHRAFTRAYGVSPAPAHPPVEPAASCDPEARYAELVRALADLQRAHAALQADWKAAARALHELSERHADTTMRLNRLASEYAALRDTHESTMHAVREERQRYEALRDDRRRGDDDFDVVLRQLSPNPPPRRFRRTR